MTVETFEKRFGRWGGITAAFKYLKVRKDVYWSKRLNGQMSPNYGEGRLGLIRKRFAAGQVERVSLWSMSSWTGRVHPVGIPWLRGPGLTSFPLLQDRDFYPNKLRKSEVGIDYIVSTWSKDKKKFMKG